MAGQNDPQDPDDRAGRCPARSARTGQPCRNEAGKDTPHLGFGLCKWHGGRTPNGMTNGMRLMAEAGMAAVRASYGSARPNVQLGVEILQEVSRTVGCIAFLEEQMAALEPRELVQGTRSIRRKEGPAGVEVTTEVAVAPSPWLELHQRERKHLVTVLDLGVKAGIEMRRLKLAEAEGEMMGLLLRAALEEFPPEVQPAAYARIRTRLAQLKQVS